VFCAKVGFGPLFLFWYNAMEDKAAESPLLQRLTELVQPVVEDLGCELIEAQFRREAHGWVLRLIIDREDGVGIDDCADISREVSSLLEVEDLIEQAYTLEVSSPGLDRPLKSERDFARCLGKKAKVVSRESLAGENVFVGLIEAVSPESVIIATDQGKKDIPFAIMKKARLIIDF